jgi:predicted PurR-regulated permease PerM
VNHRSSPLLAEREDGSTTPHPPARVEIDIAPATIIKVGAALAGVWLVAKVWPVLVLVLLSLMLVATFNPLVRQLQARFSRTWSITAVTFAVVLLGAALLVLMIPPWCGRARTC